MSLSRGGGVLDDYDLVQEIGRGTTTTVHKAICMRGRLFSRVFAIKIPHPATGLSDETKYLRCLELHQELHHPNILALYSVIPLGIQVTEYCSLGSLAEVTGSRPLPESTVLCILRGLTNALVYLHGRLIVHRTIRPAFILLDSNQTPKLTHFEEYTAPEIVQEEPASFPADVWSLGCVVLYMLSGRPPSARPASDDIFKTEEYTCNLTLRDFISGMLCYRPSDRLSASILASSMISYARHNIPVERVSALFDKDCTENLVTAPQATGNSKRVRRASLEGIEHWRFKQLLSRKPEGEIRGHHPTRRIVSDPLTPRRNHKIDELQLCKKLDPVEPDIRPCSAKAPGGPSKGAEVPESRRNTEKLPLIDVSCLEPQSVKCKEITVSVLKNKHVLIEFSDVSKKESGINTMVIDICQNQIKVYRDPVSKDHLRPNLPKSQYTKENLPADLGRYYQLASEAIGQMRKRAPKLVAYTADGKYSLMMNGPPGDVEVSFSQFATFDARGTRSDEQDKSTFRIRYSQDEGLAEFRRFVGGVDGKFWTKKCMTSVFNPEEISQAEWARLDSTERAGLERLIQFSEACKTMELAAVFGAQRLSAPLCAELGQGDCPAIVALASFIPRRPNKLCSSVSRGYSTT